MVQYAYTEMSGGQNNSRLVSMTYPNGRVLSYNYNVGLDSSISRLSSISDNSGTLESYTYLGLGTVVQRSHPQTNVNQTFINPNGLTGDAGDKYTGLDRFGRIVEEAFINAITKAYTDDYLYTYDRDSNVLTKVNNLHTAFNETYTYNGLNELTGYTRANGDSQSYGLDAVGNMTSVNTNGTNQTRTQNAQNELTGVSGATTPVYDKNGNLTTDEAGQTYTYDAWNRLVKVVSGTNIVSYSFDALGRRVTETTNAVTRDLFFDATNIIEERLAGNSNANIQYVWCPLCVNTLVLRDRDTLGLGTLNERLYYQTDANNNVTALVDTTSAVDERYVYTPYGTVTVYTAGWSLLSGTQYANQYGFQQFRVDSTTGDDDSESRVYRPSIQLWTGMDPIGFRGGQTNLYEPEGDNPVNRTDPSGQDWVMPWNSQADWRPSTWAVTRFVRDQGQAMAANASGAWNNLTNGTAAQIMSGHGQAMAANASGAWNNLTNGTAAQIMSGHGQAMAANASSAWNNANSGPQLTESPVGEPGTVGGFVPSRPADRILRGMVGWSRITKYPGGPNHVGTKRAGPRQGTILAADAQALATLRPHHPRLLCREPTCGTKFLCLAAGHCRARSGDQGPTSAGP